MTTDKPLKDFLFLCSTLWLLAGTPAKAQSLCTTGASVLQWRCWEQQITSSVNFYSGGTGNPYRDLILRVTFSNPGTGAIFTQDAFWLADTTNSMTVKNFKVRAALPPGSWTWQVASCSGTTGGNERELPLSDERRRLLTLPRCQDVGIRSPVLSELRRQDHCNDVERRHPSRSPAPTSNERRGLGLEASSAQLSGDQPSWWEVHMLGLPGFP
jgi:hypothetical protein